MEYHSYFDKPNKKVKEKKAQAFKRGESDQDHDNDLERIDNFTMRHFRGSSEDAEHE
jgi:hypothetical protein